MKKITQPAKIWSLITGFLFFSIIFSTASTSGLADLEITDITVGDVLCPTDPSGTINITVTGGSLEYSYKWIKKDGTEYNTQEPELKGLLPGIYEVTVSDINGSSPPVTSTPIEVKATDDVAPIITVTHITEPADSGSCATDLTPEATPTDNCSTDPTPTGTRDDGLALTEPYPVGTTTITWNVTDDNGNKATPVEQEIRVTENQAPVAVAKDFSISLDATGNVTVTPEQVDNGSSDNCGFSLSLSPNTFDCSDIGPNPVTLTAIDLSGNTSTATATVTVNAPAGPTALTKNITVPLDASGRATITAADIDNGSFCAIANMTLDNTEFDCTNLGENTVILTVTDADGNVNTAQAIVTVEDNTPPVITLSEVSNPIPTTAGTCEAEVTITDPTITDNCGVATLTSSSRSDGKPLTDPYPAGTTTITWNGTDDNGNKAVPVEQKIIVKENQAPDAVAKDIPVSLDDTGNAVITPADVDNGSSDNCEFFLTLDQTTFDCSNIGLNTVTLTATDLSGNTSIATATVTVDAPTGPTALTKDISVQLDASGKATITAADIDNGSFDCSIAQMTLDKTEFTCSDLGKNTITLTVTDADSNSNEATATVTVEDITGPTVIAQDITVQLDSDGLAIITADEINNGSTDNCAIDFKSLDITEFNCSNLGENTVTLTVTDVNGNFNNATALVTVEDKTPPVIPPLPDITTSCQITLTPPTTTDNCTASADIIVTTEQMTYPAQNNTAIHTVTWRFEDEAGNVVTAPQKLTINPFYFNNINPTAITCNGGSDGSITIEASGGKQPFKYALDAGNFGDSSSFTGLPQGTYLAKVKDATGCVLEETIEITEPDPLVYTPPAGEETTTMAESCYGAADGEITINGNLTGGYGNYVYVINGVAYNSNPITGLSAGEYDIFVEDTNGCTLLRTLQATIQGPDPLYATVTPTQVKCYQSSTGALTISNPVGGNTSIYSFRINRGPWQTNSTPTGYQFSQLSRGTYTVEMKDSSGCIVTLGTYTLSEPEELLPNVTTTRTTTYGSTTGTATANPTGGTLPYTYEWKDSTGAIIAVTKTISGLKGGSYTLTVKDSKGCSSEPEVFEILDAVHAEINAISVCADTDDTIRTSTFQVDLDKTIGGEGEAYKFTYIWDFGEGSYLTDGSTPAEATGIGPFVVNYYTTGDKTITLTVIEEGENPTETEFIFQHYVGECFETCDSSSNFIAYNDSFYIGDENGVQMDPQDCDASTPMYIWFIVQKSKNVYRLYSEFIYTVSTPTSTKQYRATNCYEKLDSNGVPLIVPENSKVRLNQIGTGENQIHWKCDEVINLIHITYKWTNNNKNACGDTERNMCASTNETIPVATPIGANAEASGTCYDADNGSIIVYAYGGTSDFDYTAYNTTTNIYYSPTGNVFNDLPAGNYTVTVTDKKEVAEELGQKQNSIVLTDIIVKEPEKGLSAEIESTDISCFGAQDGTAELLNVAGGTPFIVNDKKVYKYLWNDPAGTTDAYAEGLDRGTYTVTITDAAGCTELMDVTINEPDEMTTANAGPDQIRCGITSLTLEANTPVSGEGRWTISSASVGGATIVDVEDANSNFKFDTTTGGEYVLTWTISGNNECADNSDSVKITILEVCNYLDFDGVDDYVDMGDNYNFDSGPYSLEAWVKPKTISGTKTILSKRNAASSDGYELVITSNGDPGFKIRNFTIIPDEAISLNTRRWYHIAVTFDGASIIMYVDGLQVKKVTGFGTTNPGNPETTNASFLIGATYAGLNSTKLSSHFHGWIEEVRLWKKALSQEQIQFMMNQRLAPPIDNNQPQVVKGEVLPLLVPPVLIDPEDPTSEPVYLMWSDLAGYYQLLSEKAEAGGGTTSDLSDVPVPGVLKNITSLQKNTAPLPYVSVRDGNWRDIGSTTTPWKHGSGTWDAPNSLGINQKAIEWNIVRTYDRITSGNQNITVLGLLSEKRPHEELPEVDGRFKSTLSILDPNHAPDEYNPGHGLRVTHYLRLNGAIDLVGESQLIQDEGSILEEASTGYIERDQQGTASSFNYNYWSSPVSPTGSANNSPYTVKSVLRDGTDPAKPGPINFKYQYHWADGNYDGNKRISTYWLHTYTNRQSNTYSEWIPVRENGEIKVGEGFTMKGTSGSAAITDRQNYTFVGKPNNGTIRHEVTLGNDYLVGNPYPSAIDSWKFIKDNILTDTKHDGLRDKNVFNGTLYFWDHFAGKTHYLQRYVGGYATLNLSGGTTAIATDERINANDESASTDLNPRRFIPVGQAFYVSTHLPEELSGLTTISGGDITFKNSQRVFETEHQRDDESIFKSKEEKKAQKENSDKRFKVYLRYSSPEGFHRQLLVTRDSITSEGFDLGYDAPLIEDIDEDMYWVLHNVGFVIQGVPEFDKSTDLPLTVKLHEEGEFTIAIDQLENIPEGLPIHLKDTLSGNTHDLRESPFKITAPGGSIEGRFSLVFPIKEVVKEPTEKEVGAETIKSYYSSKDSKVSIENPFLVPIKSAILYNINGQKLLDYGEIPLEKLVELPVDTRATGVYIMKLQMENESESIKFIVK